ncbi:MAG: hypothetical protein JJU36_16150 [Phycisphaeraceae bacterium]|nr:hypothetical protein [Phycisphaeraceae bacterium]
MNRHLVYALLIAIPLWGCGDGPPASETDTPRDTPSTTARPTDPDGAATVNVDADRRFGDPGKTRISGNWTEQYPQIDLWARAGVSGGIPTMEDSPKLRIAPGESIAEAVASLERGIIELEEGEYTIDGRLFLGSNVILRGLGDGATIRFGSGTDKVAIDVRDAQRVGVENIRLKYADPLSLATGEHLRDHIWANSPGFTPTPEAAIQFTGVTDGWLDRITIENALSHPLAIRDCRHITLRDLALHGALNRGHGSGSWIIENTHHLLAAGISVRKLRGIRLVGPARGNVFTAMVSGAGFHLHEADRITENLFEDCHWLFRPGYPFRPLAKGAMPMGDGNIVHSCRTYFQGTDAIAGNVLEPGKAFQINPFAVRPNAGREAERHERGLISPYMHEQPLTTREVRIPVIQPQWPERPANLPITHLRNRAGIQDWAWTTNIGPQAHDVPISELLDEPLRDGTERTLAGRQATVAWTEPRVRPQLGEFTDSTSANRNMGQFGWAVQPPGGGEVDLLERVDGDWEGGIILQRIVHIPGRPLVRPSHRIIGAEVRMFLGDKEIQENEIYRLEPGYHALTVMVRLHRAMALVTTASLALSFQLEDEPTPTIRSRLARVPDRGGLYPFNPGIDPLADEREALDEWPTFHRQVLHRCPLPDVKEQVEDFARRHTGTHASWVALGALEVLNRAPHDEADFERLTSWQWGELMDYYARAMMPERKWTGTRAKSGASEFRAFYPWHIEDDQ